MQYIQDTIYALSTPVGGAIAVIRASGPACVDALRVLTEKDFRNRPRQLLPAALVYQGRLLDEAMAVFFQGPISYTGEDMLELHCHGGIAVVQAVLLALGGLSMRPAEPGEFTRRAFLNGKMDLSQAEGVMDLIQARTALSAKAALQQMRGQFSKDITQLEDYLTQALASINAAIDYPEELEEDVLSTLPALLQNADASLSTLIAQGETGRILREGFRIVLLGAPNAGKSSLLNALLGYERAIVTHLPGTTRDTLEECISMEGIPVLLMDTAGLREALDMAEGEGIRRAYDAAQEADAVLLLLDGTKPPDEAAYGLLEQTARHKRILLRTKADLPMTWEWDALSGQHANAGPMLTISVKTGEGMDALKDEIVGMAGPVGEVYITNQRHVRAMREAADAVRQAAVLLHGKAECNMDSAAIDLRDALVALGSITGSAVDEHVIERIFEQFCVGK